MAQNTIASGRAWIYSHNVGRGAAAGTGFRLPVGVATAKNDVLFVANRGLAASAGGTVGVRISKVTLDHQFLGEFGRNGDGPGEFTWLTAVALDRDENVYTTDEWLDRVTVFDNDGNTIKTWGESGDGKGQLRGPSGLVFDADENLLIVNGGNSRVQKFTKDGRYISGFGKKGSGEGELDMPWGINLDQDGNIFVADWLNNRVQKFSSDGTFLLTFGHGGAGPGSLDHPAGVAIDGDGDVYVADSEHERVVIYDSTAKLLAYLTGDAVDVSAWAQMSIDANPDVAKARRRVDDLEQQQRYFRIPTSVNFDRENNRLIVCDTQRSRLQIYEKDNSFQDPQLNL